jgi:hypothetical protein
MFGPELVEAFGEFKAIWDPDGKMNPGKGVDRAPPAAHLRPGTDHRPPRPSPRSQPTGRHAVIAPARSSARTKSCAGQAL